MNPMFNEYKDAGKIQEALLIGRNMVNKAPGDSECVNAYLDFLLMLAEKLPRTDERKSFADQANLVLSFYEENADLCNRSCIHTIGFSFAKAETFSVQVGVQRIHDIDGQVLVKKKSKNVVAVMSGSLKSYFYFV